MERCSHNDFFISHNCTSSINLFFFRVCRNCKFQQYFSFSPFDEKSRRTRKGKSKQLNGALSLINKHKHSSCIHSLSHFLLMKKNAFLFFSFTCLLSSFGLVGGQYTGGSRHNNGVLWDYRWRRGCQRMANQDSCRRNRQNTGLRNC